MGDVIPIRRRKLSGADRAVILGFFVALIVMVVIAVFLVESGILASWIGMDSWKVPPP